MPKYLSLIFAFVIFISAPLLADVPEDRMTREQIKTYQEVENNILSPFCPGRLLRDCPSTAARDLKKDIKERILAGGSAEEVVSALITEYGDELKAAPDSEGFGLVGWYAPLAFLLFGFILLVVWVSRQTEKD